jgi:hypothetical protein
VRCDDGHDGTGRYCRISGVAAPIQHHDSGRRGEVVCGGYCTFWRVMGRQ